MPRSVTNDAATVGAAIEPGSFVELRGRPWLVEEVQGEADDLQTLNLSCISDDAQGERLEIHRAWAGRLARRAGSLICQSRLAASFHAQGIYALDVLLFARAPADSPSDGSICQSGRDSRSVRKADNASTFAVRARAVGVMK
jgi:hypothetical protein